MEVILTEDIRSLGKAGEVVKVKDGFARNCLLPQKKALVADASNRQRVDQERKKREVHRARDREEAGLLAEKLRNLACTVTKQAGEGEKLFGSVTAMDVAQALANEGLSIDKKMIPLEEPIKKLGTYKIELKLHPEVTASVTVKVVGK